MMTDANSVQQWMTPEIIGHPNNSIHIWLGHIGSLKQYLGFFKQALPQAELEKYEKTPIERVRHRQIVARGCLRLLLGAYLGQAPETLLFTHGCHGKPSLLRQDISRELHFNLTHSQDIVLFVFSGNPNLGIDCECIDGQRKRNWRSISKRVFTSEEQKELAELAELEQEIAFHRGWTRKEAYTKAIGDGFQYGFESFSVTLNSKHPPQIRSDEKSPLAAESWQLLDIYIDKSALATLCFKKSDQLPDVKHYFIDAKILNLKKPSS